MQNQVLAVARGQRATLDGDVVGADGVGHQDAAARDGQTSGRIERDLGGLVEAQRVDGEGGGADGGQGAVVDVGARDVGRPISGQRGDPAGTNRGEARADFRGGVAAEDVAGAVGGGDEDSPGTHAREDEVDGRTRRRTGNGAEVQAEGRRGVERAGGARGARQQGQAVELLDGGHRRLAGDVQGAAAQFERARRVDHRRRRHVQRVEVELERAAAHDGLARVIAAVGGLHRERRAADLVEAAESERTEGADAPVDGAGELGRTTARQGELKAVEVQDAAHGRDDGGTDAGGVDGGEGNVTQQLDGGAGQVVVGARRMRIEIELRLRGRAVDGVTGVEGIGVVQVQRADAVAGSETDDFGVAEVGADAVQAEDAAPLLLEGARRPIGADAAREDHRVAVGGAVGVELGAAVDDDAGEVGR